MVILDTDLMSLLEWQGKPSTERLRARLGELPEAQVATTVITYEEQIRGWMKYLAGAKKQAQIIEAYRRLLSQLRNYCRILVLAFDEPAAAHAQRLKKMKLKMGAKDYQIAGIALAHEAILLTRNLAHFNQVPDLRVEDWTV